MSDTPLENRQSTAVDKTPSVHCDVTIYYGGDVSRVLDKWTIPEIEALLDRSHDEYECAVEALVSEVDRLEVDGSDASVYTGQLWKYIEHRKAKGLTGRVA